MGRAASAGKAGGRVCVPLLAAGKEGRLSGCALSLCKPLGAAATAATAPRDCRRRRHAQAPFARQPDAMDLDASSLHYLFASYLDGPDLAACAQVRRRRPARAAAHLEPPCAARLLRKPSSTSAAAHSSTPVPPSSDPGLPHRCAAPGAPWRPLKRSGSSRWRRWIRTPTCAGTTCCRVRCRCVHTSCLRVLVWPRSGWRAACSNHAASIRGCHAWRPAPRPCTPNKSLQPLGAATARTTRGAGRCCAARCAASWWKAM